MFGRKTLEKKRVPTPAIEEGPYYKPNSPERQVIAEPGVYGSKLIVEGRVLDVYGKSIAHAWMDFWQADGKGQYDNADFKLRGHQFTDKNGRYYLETVRPVGYENRAPHIHAKVRATENSPILTTQLFFAGDIKNATDLIYDELAVMYARKFKDGEKVTFDFVAPTE